MIARNLFKHLICIFFVLAFAMSVLAQDRQPNPTNPLHMNAKPAVVPIRTGYTGQWAWRKQQSTPRRRMQNPL